MLPAFVCALALLLHDPAEEIRIPVNTPGRQSIENMRLTPIGAFGLPRKERPSVRSHLHAGIDIRRPGSNYRDEPVYPIAAGIIISKRIDGPFAQLILEHEIGGKKFWSVYEHIGGVTVGLHARVSPSEPIARFFTREELDRYGWQFDHFHLEVLKEPPRALKPDSRTPERMYASRSLECVDQSILTRYFYDPLEFLAARWGVNR